MAAIEDTKKLNCPARVTTDYTLQKVQKGFYRHSCSAVHAIVREYGYLTINTRDNIHSGMDGGEWTDVHFGTRKREHQTIW